MKTLETGQSFEFILTRRVKRTNHKMKAAKLREFRSQTNEDMTMAVVIAFLNCKLIKPKATFTVSAAGFEPTSYEEPYNGSRL